MEHIQLGCDVIPSSEFPRKMERTQRTDGISMSGGNSFSDEAKTPVLERVKRWIQGNF